MSDSKRVKEKAIIVARCSTNESKQDVTRQTEELQMKYANQYDIVKEFSYYRSGVKNEAYTQEILSYSIENNIKHIITLETSRISRKISTFALFLEKCNENRINIIIDYYKLHTLLEGGELNYVAQMCISMSSSMAKMELEITKERLNSGREKYIRDGGVLGRKKGSTKSKEKFLHENKVIVRLLKEGQSNRNTSKISGKSKSTVEKVRALIKEQLPTN